MNFVLLFRKIKKRFAKIKKMIMAKPPKMKFFFAFFFKFFKIVPDTILVESFHGSNISDSSLALVREILRSYPGKYKIYYGTIDKTLHQKFIEDI